jgi:hemolysin III
MVTPSTGEEIANSITHGLGALLSIVGLVILLITAITHGTALQIIAAAVFGTTLILLYFASTLYHALTPPRAKHVFQILDHSAIYLLIAGTYTPFTLITLRGIWGWTLFAVIWSLAVFGVVFKSIWIDRHAMLSTAVYVLMGWCAIIVIRPLLRGLPWDGFLWLLAGGLAYTAGVVFYASRRPYAHAVWHLFVLSGSACHYWTIYRYVLAR